jgi:hypothetical protein
MPDPSQDERPSRLATDDFPVPPFMHARRCGCLRLTFDTAALEEYEQDPAAYDAIFAHTSKAVEQMLRHVPQCPIWLHGTQGCWRFGHELKRRDHGVDLGAVEHGIAWHGNMHYEGHPDQNDSIFVINLPRAVLGHSMVFVHELTHHFHRSVGPERLPMITAAFERVHASLGVIRTRFGSEIGRNGPQFEYTLSNEMEFFAYMMEAYHSSEGTGGAAIVFDAPAFPRTRSQLHALDDLFQLGIAAALDEAMLSGGCDAATQPQPSTSHNISGKSLNEAEALANSFREQFERIMAASPHHDANETAAALLKSFMNIPHTDTVTAASCNHPRRTRM